MDLPIPETLLSDPQLRGRAQRLMVAKDTYHPARPLKASELAALEKAMDSGMDTRDVYLFGCSDFCSTVQIKVVGPQVRRSILGRACRVQWGAFWICGGQNKVPQDGHESCKKVEVYALVAPLQGVTDVDWSKFWLESMLELNVDINHEPFWGNLQGPSQGGGLCARSCTSEEIGAFINKLLKTGSDNSISSHSFKHTTLVWCSAYGLDEPSRTLLGHHELQGSKSMAVYSRDMLTRPLQLLLQHVVKHQEGPFPS